MIGVNTARAARATERSRPSRELAWCNLLQLELDYTHGVKVVADAAELSAVDDLDLCYDDVMVNMRFRDLCDEYHMWRAADLRAIAHLHHVRTSSKDTAATLFQKLSCHECFSSCRTVIVVFTTLCVPRVEAQVVRKAIHTALPVEQPESFMDVADETLKKGIIKEWQEEISTDALAQVVCAVCARNTLRKDTQHVHASEIELTLLRNDALPPNVLPTTYNFECYQRALLCPEGMTNRAELGNLTLCSVCHRELLIKRRMPKLCLANWLYFAHDELPDTVKRAFRDATQFDRMLVSRARASRISYRFTELRKDNAAGTPLFSVLDWMIESQSRRRSGLDLSEMRNVLWSQRVAVPRTVSREILTAGGQSLISLHAQGLLWLQNGRTLSCFLPVALLQAASCKLQGRAISSRPCGGRVEELEQVLVLCGVGMRLSMSRSRSRWR